FVSVRCHCSFAAGCRSRFWTFGWCIEHETWKSALHYLWMIVHDHRLLRADIPVLEVFRVQSALRSEDEAYRRLHVGLIIVAAQNDACVLRIGAIDGEVSITFLMTVIIVILLGRAVDHPSAEPH
ncbi:LOW QUALITY PROTEIN: hypothetical protein M8C21_027915, partial [Ambrosia artemisiifolia]